MCRPSALLAVLVAFAATPLSAASPPAPTLELRLARQGARTLLIRPTTAGAKIETGDRTASSLTLPAGAALSSLVATREGWVAAGVRPLASGSELLFIAWENGTDRPLAEPGDRGDRRDQGDQGDRVGAFRESPVLLATGGRLAAALWLEGDRRDGLAVRAARWQRSGHRIGWSAPVTISPKGPGSQLALTAVALADGELLALWSAFDGEDDEILWSRTSQERGGSWSAPRPLAPGNSVPDITPAIALTPTGALAAWNRYDGDGYSLLGARFDGERWSAPYEIATSGALFPSFDRLGDDLVLLVRQAKPRGWEAMRIDAAGRPGARAAVESSGPERPVLEKTRDGGVRFVWVDRSTDASWDRALTER